MEVLIENKHIYRRNYINNYFCTFLQNNVIETL